MSCVYVGNLDHRVTERELEDEFRRFGVLRSVWVARKPPGFAFIEFDDPRDADDAIRALDNKNGWRVELSRSSGGRGPRGRGRDGMGCYECGERGHFARECRLRIERGPGAGAGGGRSRSPRYRRSPSYGGGGRRRRSRSPSYGPYGGGPAPIGSGGGQPFGGGVGAMRGRSPPRRSGSPPFSGGGIRRYGGRSPSPLRGRGGRGGVGFGGGRGDGDLKGRSPSFDKRRLSPSPAYGKRRRYSRSPSPGRARSRSRSPPPVRVDLPRGEFNNGNGFEKSTRSPRRNSRSPWRRSPSPVPRRNRSFSRSPPLLGGDRRRSPSPGV
ncbi:hypothetical protein CBR_g860 [Chara braunii]|uniref:CCHC-type domain-containing protein n=1 Tax=Chara braunii TaxID=69332 RepID=A0A388KCD6_CHABU|nr:hypothetical protein CBR_g860 [Chara braunii]|eukprot:GBG67732.1 hypothetical protein CBR_g860 [Chara braunii]